VLVDCNRLPGPSLDDFLSLTAQSGQFPHNPSVASGASPAHGSLEAGLRDRLAEPPGALCILFDRFEAVIQSGSFDKISAHLRAIRDGFKYKLTYILTTRRPVPPDSELAELFFGNTILLGPLDEPSARWSAASYAVRRGREWDAETLDKIVTLSGAYPSLLRAVCEAYAAGTSLERESLARHPAVKNRVAEFWASEPDPDAIRQIGLDDIPLLENQAESVDPLGLTAKESLLLDHLRAHPGELCTKETLIQAVWPEDRIFTDGIRDDSLAQLVRRLRKKIEPDPNHPRRIQSVPGRGYWYRE
jgi:hypothetical protein